MPELTQAPNLEPTIEQTIEPLVLQRAEIKARLDAVQQELDAVNGEISGTMLREGVRNLRVAGFSLTYESEAEKNTLDKTKLVELGVSTDVIAKATKKTTYARFDVRELKSK
jgi:hypothetical protein